MNNGKLINNKETINTDQPMNNNLTMISNILKEPTINNKEYLISDILNKSMISNILKQLISNNSKETLINNILKQSTINKILKGSTIRMQSIPHNKESLIKDLTINNILTQPMENNLKESLINDTLQQSVINNTLKQPISDDLKKSLISNNLKQSMVNNILKEPTINTKELLIKDILNDNEIINNNNETTNKKSLINNNETINKELTTNNNKKINKKSECKAFLTIFIKSTSYKKESTNTVKTPENLKPKKAVLNQQSNDNKSFQYSVTLSLHHKDVGKNPCRISNIGQFINNLNWENINFPPTEQDYQQFEMNNTSIALNILQVSNEEKISHLYKSRYSKTRENKLILLQLENKHYTFVKDLDSLLKSNKNNSSLVLTVYNQI